MNLNRVLEQIRRKYLLRQDSMDEGGWKTINGTHVLIDNNGEMVGGPENLRKWNNARREKAGIKKPRAKAEPLKAENFPAAFRKGTERNKLQKFIDFVNSREGANPKVVALFNAMGKLENLESNGIGFKISHAQEHSVATRIVAATRKLVSVKLTIPKLHGDDLTGQINSIIHEEMHLMDLYGRKDEKIDSDWFSSNRPTLMAFFKGKSNDISDEVRKLFDDFNSVDDDSETKIKSGTKEKLDKLKDKYCPNGESIYDLDVEEYDEYIQEKKKLLLSAKQQKDYESRNLMGGGIGNLQDIYDALSGGALRDGGIVRYGHGTKYYRNTEQRVHETVANYASLSITRPDLVDMLRRDKPELVKELDSCIEDLLKKAEERG